MNIKSNTREIRDNCLYNSMSIHLKFFSPSKIMIKAREGFSKNIIDTEYTPMKFWIGNWPYKWLKILKDTFLPNNNLHNNMWLDDSENGIGKWGSAPLNEMRDINVKKKILWRIFTLRYPSNKGRIRNFLYHIAKPSQSNVNLVI